MKQYGRYALLCGALALGLTACGGPEKQEEAKETQAQTAAAETVKETEEKTEETKESVAVLTPDETSEENPDGFSYGELEGIVFYFSSGAGAWHTELRIHPDGSFDGEYQDSDMGDLGDSYPNGTIYLSLFSGMLGEPVGKDDGVYELPVSSLDYVYEAGEEIEDGIRYIYTDAYGLTGTEVLDLYLPEARTEILPEMYLDWVRSQLPAGGDGTLSFYGLYNPAEETGFSGYVEVTPYESAQSLIEEALLQEEKLQTALDQSDKSQFVLNQTAYDMYAVWDETLNEIWSLLNEMLDPDVMSALLDEQRSWIREKEAASEKAGEEEKGGSLYNLCYYSEALSRTRDRVFELAEYLK